MQVDVTVLAFILCCAIMYTLQQTQCNRKQQMASLTKQQRVYVQLQAALDALHEEHFPAMDDASSVLGDDVEQAEVQDAVRAGETLLQELLK